MGGLQRRAAPRRLAGIEAPGFSGPEADEMFARMARGDACASGLRELASRLDGVAPGELATAAPSVALLLRAQRDAEGPLRASIADVLRGCAGPAAPEVTAPLLRAIAAAGYFGAATLRPLERLQAAGILPAGAAGADVQPLWAHFMRAVIERSSPRIPATLLVGHARKRTVRRALMPTLPVRACSLRAPLRRAAVRG